MKIYITEKKVQNFGQPSLFFLFFGGGIVNIISLKTNRIWLGAEVINWPSIL
jgi:hypothetical protein